jgi:hypothetical protein
MKNNTISEAGKGDRNRSASKKFWDSDYWDSIAKKKAKKAKKQD